MSQMPSKIWLHKDTKYSTGDIVCGYQYDFVQGIEDEGGIENFVKYVPADAFIEKAQLFLIDKLKEIPMGSNKMKIKAECSLDEFIENFKNYMEGNKK